MARAGELSPETARLARDLITFREAMRRLRGVPPPRPTKCGGCGGLGYQRRIDWQKFMCAECKGTGLSRRGDL